MRNHIVAAIAIGFLLASATSVNALPTCPGFNPAGTYPVGQPLVVADFDNNGKADLASVSGANVRVTLSQGNTFGAVVAYPIAANNGVAAVGDFNGDGKLDIAVVGTDMVSVILGDGGGSFGASIDTAFTGSAIEVAVGDVNSDGKADLVFTTTNDVEFLIGNGDGTFILSANSIAAGTNPWNIVVVKVNGDSYDDVVLLMIDHSDSGLPRAIITYLGNGDGTFTAALLRHVAGTVKSMVLGDFDKNGVLDADVADDQNVHNFLIGNGDGTWSAGEVNMTACCTGPRMFSNPRMIAGDYNNDGRLDLFVSVPSCNQVNCPPQFYTLLGNGFGHFTLGRIFSSMAGPYFAGGDFNGDGAPDVVNGDNTVYLNAHNLPCAVVNSVSPLSGPTAGDDPVTLTGVNLDSITDVTFGGVSGSITKKFFDLLEVLTPAHAPANVPIQVTSPAGMDDAGAFYTFVLPPSISSISPSSGPSTGGQSVTVTGSNFAGVSSVAIGGIGVPFTSTATTITFTTPAHSGGFVDVAVTTAGGTATASYVYGETSTVVSSSANPSMWGQDVTFAATVTSPFAGTITGTVTFRDGGTLIGTTLVKGGAVATLRTNRLAVGSHTISASYSGDPNYAPNTGAMLTQNVNPGAWTSFSAQASSTSSAVLNWTANGAVVHYEIYRSSSGNAFSLLTTVDPPATSYTDTSLNANTTYLYKMLWRDSGANPSAFTPIDAATTIVFTDMPITPGMLPRPEDILELRTGVNAMRVAAGLTPITSFTDPTIVAGMFMKAAHVNELRSGLAIARDTIGLSELALSDVPVTSSTLIKAEHIQQLRDGLE